MNRYDNLHKWMLLPMLIMQLGIFKDYWGDFSENAWSVHIHYWTGTVWYLYLIMQPYFITTGQVSKHKTNGMIGIFLAGGVCLTALSMLNRDMVNAQNALETPEKFGPFHPWFFYGVAVVELVMMTAFGFAIIKGILHRKELENHAWWLTSTVFIIMMPALARGMQGLYIQFYIKDWPDINIIIPIYYTQVLIIGMVLLGAWKFEKLKHPATYLALTVNLFIFLLEPIGKSEYVQALLKVILKG